MALNRYVTEMGQAELNEWARKAQAEIDRLTADNKIHMRTIREQGATITQLRQEIRDYEEGLDSEADG